MRRTEAYEAMEEQVPVFVLEPGAVVPYDAIVTAVGSDTATVVDIDGRAHQVPLRCVRYA